MAEKGAFFYGTLMAREILYRVVYGTSNIKNKPEFVARASKLTFHSAILHDYCRHKVMYADYPGIVPKKGSTVRGTYVTGLADKDFVRLDRFEGDDYTMKNIKVALLADDKETGEVVDAVTYAWSSPVHQLEREEWDYAHFRKEKMKNWHDASEEFEDSDGDVAASPGQTAGPRLVEIDDEDLKAAT